MSSSSASSKVCVAPASQLDRAVKAPPKEISHVSGESPSGSVAEVVKESSAPGSNTGDALAAIRAVGGADRLGALEAVDADLPVYAVGDPKGGSGQKPDPYRG